MRLVFRVLLSKPVFSPFWWMYVACSGYQGLIKEAIHCYMTAVRLMPKFAAVHSNLGSVLKEQGKLVRDMDDNELKHWEVSSLLFSSFSCVGWFHCV